MISCENADLNKNKIIALPKSSENLLVIREDNITQVYELEKKVTSIGRSPADDILLTSKGVSRSHATIYFANGFFWIADGNLKGRLSTNGLFVNDSRIAIHKLKQYDLITFQEGVHAFYLHQRDYTELGASLRDLTKNIIYFVSGNNLDQQLLSPASLLNGSSQDIQSSTAKFSHLDNLTKIPGRDAFFARVKRSLEFRLKTSATYHFAVLFIDVDRFKMINDSLGHLVGDKFLVQLSKRLENCLREGDMVARLGGDEFAILLDDLPLPEEAITVAKRIQQSLVKPLEIETHEIYPSISIGIALSTLGYTTVKEIIRDADTAMYHAKNTGRSRFVVFDADMHKEAVKLLQLNSDLRKAIDRKELQLHYQPIVCLRDKKLVGFEALIRWNHPENGLISPADFIPIAEEANLIYQIGQWVFDEACQQLFLWQTNPQITTRLSVNINISSKQLTETRLVERLVATIEKYGISAQDIKLEVTESILMENTMHSLKILNQLKQVGFQIGIDDFGTGYSSLSYLNKFPIDVLKVDRSFISQIDIADQNTSASITNSIITLAHSLGVSVVAEGVERLYHLQWLQMQNCDYGQGYLFSEPLTPDKATCLAEQGLDWAWKC